MIQTGQRRMLESSFSLENYNTLAWLEACGKVKETQKKERKGDT